MIARLAGVVILALLKLEETLAGLAEAHRRRLVPRGVERFVVHRAPILLLPHKGLQSNSGGFVRDDSASATHDRDDRDALSVALNERRPQTVGQFGGLGLGGKLAEREGFGLSAIL